MDHGSLSRGQCRPFFPSVMGTLSQSLLAAIIPTQPDANLVRGRTRIRAIRALPVPSALGATELHSA